MKVGFLKNCSCASKRFIRPIRPDLNQRHINDSTLRLNSDFFTVKEINGHLETCCSDPLCTVKMKQAAKELMEANEKINQLKIKLAEWQTLNRFGQF